MDWTFVVRAPQVTFIQTSDPYVYSTMLDHTGRTVKAFCHRHGHAYESYTRIKRGNLPWHATYNRIYILNEMVDRGYRGWAIYLDADAFIADQRFDLGRLLFDHADEAAIMTLAGEPQDWWDVNAGVLLMNLKQSKTRSLIRRWKRLLDRVPDRVLFTAEMWAPGLDDQSFLQVALRQRPAIRRHIYFSSMSLINSPRASFIRQFIRPIGTNEERTELIKEEVCYIFQDVP